jgi:hypothetical protein
MATPGRPKRSEPVTKTAWYATDADIDNINRIRVDLFAKEKIQANTNTDVISVVLKKYCEFTGIRKAHGKIQG